MKSVYDYSLLYELQHKAVNDPLRFIVAHEKKIKAQTLPEYVYDFFIARARLITGETQTGLNKLMGLGSQITSSGNLVLKGLYYLTLYNIHKLIGANSQTCDSDYNLAMQLCKSSGNPALACESKMLDCRKNYTSYTLDACEDLLKAAMHDAVEADIMDLKLSVHLEYIVLYLNSNRPELANRELLLLGDIIDPDHNPYLDVLINNYMGIVHLMLRDPVKSEECLTRALTSSRQRHFKHLVSVVLMNLGLHKVRIDQKDAGIGYYLECLQLLTEIGLENSDNTDKTQTNLAMALAVSDQIPEAIRILRAALEKALATDNILRANTIRVNLADTIIETEVFEEAEVLLREAIEYFEQNNTLEYLISAYRCKARLHEVQSEYQAAFEAMEVLDRTSRKHFQTTFYHQSSKFQTRMDNLRNDFMLLRDRCQAETTIGKHIYNTEFIGEHPLVKKALTEARMAARYPFINVFITGESGTGKEVIARIIHNESNTGKQMVAINMSAISSNLIESELFGHKKGAFTGAVDDQKGKFVLADKGTLLLDEISEMPIECQAKLLRAIETHTIMPVGSDKEVNINCRVISASNCNIKDLIRANKFRLDLYHRLNKVEIHLTPLRDRKTDIELIANSFITRFAKEFKQPEPMVSPEFYDRLREYAFPGNVRELMNIIERIFILKPRSVWDYEQLDGLLGKERQFQATGEGLAQSLKIIEQQMITEALEHTGWVQKEAAQILKITESTLTRRIQALNISRS